MASRRATKKAPAKKAPRRKAAAKKAPRKPGRKKTPIDPAQVEKLASQGLTKAQIASIIGLSESHWYAREAKAPEITEAYKRGKSRGVLLISNALFEAARSGNITAQIFYLKSRGGWRENIRLEHAGVDDAPIKISDPRTSLMDRMARIAERFGQSQDDEGSER